MPHHTSTLRPFVPLSAALVALTACGSAVEAGGQVCTEIATRVGISLDIAPPLADRVAAATMTVCWDGVCSTPLVELAPATTAGPASCASGGTGPDVACAAEAVPTGGKHGFADLGNLPERAVRVRLTLTDTTGTTVVEQQVDTTPALEHPNGPGCPPGGPQAGLLVSGDGQVTGRAPAAGSATTTTG
ncbi:hypothetical protein [Goodfellowiella coeruleoviolacea]|uniref:hypothetical protein n=1 Tax=Goodfellowiella coeruleoviolacea TaxID=334858 RepID=UPI0020A4732F|nr:hypothetical protein [Goodfellowiella coeruleoviolacea]